MTMPLRLGPRDAVPSIVTRPSSGRSKPATMLRSVVLPHPEGPTSATNSPSPTARSIPRSTGSGPWSVAYVLLTFSTAILARIAPPDRFQMLEPPHHRIEQQARYADDHHAGDHEVIAIASVARIDDQVAEPRPQRNHLGRHDHEPRHTQTDTEADDDLRQHRRYHDLEKKLGAADAEIVGGS